MNCLPSSDSSGTQLVIPLTSSFFLTQTESSKKSDSSRLPRGLQMILEILLITTVIWTNEASLLSQTNQFKRQEVIDKREPEILISLKQPAVDISMPPSAVSHSFFRSSWAPNEAYIRQHY